MNLFLSVFTSTSIGWLLRENKVTSHGDSLMRPAKVNDYLKASNFDE